MPLRVVPPQNKMVYYSVFCGGTKISRSFRVMFHKRKIFRVGGARCQWHDYEVQFAGLLVDYMCPRFIVIHRFSKVR